MLLHKRVYNEIRACGCPSWGHDFRRFLASDVVSHYFDGEGEPLDCLRVRAWADPALVVVGLVTPALCNPSSFVPLFSAWGCVETLVRVSGQSDDVDIQVTQTLRWSPGGGSPKLS